MITVCIGYDFKESVAYHALCQSIMDHASGPVRFVPINLKNLPMFDRERDPNQSTDFSFSRFLTPYLCNYEGLAVFMDCDIVCVGDIYDILKEADGSAVQVVKHDYVPRAGKKFLGNIQTVYPKKNWSSVMLFDCAQCKVLTPEYVNWASGMLLHQFMWTDSVGSLDPKWNYLVGEDQPKSDPVLIHYTLGGPYFKTYQDCEYSAEWFTAFQRATNCAQ